MSTAGKARKALSDGRTLMVTHSADGQSYGLDTGQAVPKAVAESLQGDLFVKPSEDGLFPGHSQTWKAER
jgi:hypothetical protein